MFTSHHLFSVVPFFMCIEVHPSYLLSFHPLIPFFLCITARSSIPSHLRHPTSVNNFIGKLLQGRASSIYYCSYLTLFTGLQFDFPSVVCFVSLKCHFFFLFRYFSFHVFLLYTLSPQVHFEGIKIAFTNFTFWLPTFYILCLAQGLRNSEEHHCGHFHLRHNENMQKSSEVRKYISDTFL